MPLRRPRRIEQPGSVRHRELGRYPTRCVTGRDMPDADARWELDRESALSAKLAGRRVEIPVWKQTLGHAIPERDYRPWPGHRLSRASVTDPRRA